jgi:hypothetical protein
MHKCCQGQQGWRRRAIRIKDRDFRTCSSGNYHTMCSSRRSVVWQPESVDRRDKRNARRSNCKKIRPGSVAEFHLKCKVSYPGHVIEKRSVAVRAKKIGECALRNVDFEKAQHHLNACRRTCGCRFLPKMRNREPEAGHDSEPRSAPQARGGKQFRRHSPLMRRRTLAHLARHFPREWERTSRPLVRQQVSRRRANPQPSIEDNRSLRGKLTRPLRSDDLVKK